MATDPTRQRRDEPRGDRPEDETRSERPDDRERKSQGEREGEGEEGKSAQAGMEQHLPGFRDVLKDMAVGAVAGAVLGAAWRLARTLQPEGADALKTRGAETARQIGGAAGTAVRDVLASKPMNELLPGRGEDGKRADVMKSTLKEAVAAAGDAAKGVLEGKRSGGGTSGEQ